MEVAGWAGIVSLVVVVGREILNAINHKRLRSKCCDKEAVVSVDVEATTPPDQRESNRPQLDVRAPSN